MSAALVIVYTCLGAVEVAVVVAWVVATRRHRWPVRPSAGDVLIGGATSFLDTLGIGNYAQITALFKLRGHPPDELIPGTLNVGNAVGILLSSTLFITAVRVEPVLLMAMVISAGAGAWIGAGIVSRMRRRVIQIFMGVALLIAAGFFTMTNLGVIPPTGSAMGLAGWRFAVATVANFVLGALMCAGIGNYAPSMALLAFLGMHPIAAYPIMMASDGVLIPGGQPRFPALGSLRTRGCGRTHDRRIRRYDRRVPAREDTRRAPHPDALGRHGRHCVCRHRHAALRTSISAGCACADRAHIALCR